jgi:hypothetical protein
MDELFFLVSDKIAFFYVSQGCCVLGCNHEKRNANTNAKTKTKQPLCRGSKTKDHKMDVFSSDDGRKGGKERRGEEGQGAY